MRPLAALALLLLPALAGCVGSPQPLAPAGVPQHPTLPPGIAPFTVLRCAGDVLKPLAGDHAKDCNVQVTTKNGPAAEVSLAANPRDPLNLVGGAKDFTLGPDERCGVHNVWSGVYWTKDGGRTWGNALLPGHPNDTRKTALSDYACGSDPVLAFDAQGWVYYVGIYDTGAGQPTVPQLAPVIGYPTKNSALAVTRSRDGGATWDDPVLLGHVEDGSLFDKEWIAVDAATGQLYVSAIRNQVEQLWRSDDHGLTWTEPMNIVAQDPNGPMSAVQFGQLAVTPDHVVHFVYWAEEQGNDISNLYHLASADGGKTWSAPVLIAPFFALLDLQVTHKYRIVPMESLAADANGTLAVAWSYLYNPDAVPPTDVLLDIYASSSRDGGKTWSPANRVNDDLLPQNDQWMPQLAFGPDGTLHAVWMDYRDDPAGQSAYDYYAFSKDEGKTWSKNARLSDVAFDGTGGYHQSGAGTIGDYQGLAATVNGVHAFWADTRNQRNDVFTAFLPG